MLLYPREEDLLLVTESEQIAVIMQFFETYLFAEDVKIEGPLDDWCMMGLQGKVALECLNASFDLPENFIARKGTHSLKQHEDQKEYWKSVT